MLSVVFALSVLLSYLLVYNYVESVMHNYLINLLMSIYASTGLLLIITIIEYYDNKRHALERFYIFSGNFTRIYLKAKPFIYEDYKNDHNYLKEIIKIYEEISQLDVEALGTLYSKICLMHNNDMQMLIYNEIYLKIKHVQDEINDALWFSRNDAYDNAIINAGITKIQPLLFKSQTRYYEDSYTIKIYNDLAQEILDSREVLRAYMYKDKKINLDLRPILTKYKYNE